MTEAWNGRPPAPLDEVAGWHWTKANYEDVLRPWLWVPDRYPGGSWFRAGGAEEWRVGDFKYYHSYMQPWLTPDQIAAQIAEAVKAEREACADAISVLSDPWADPIRQLVVRSCAAFIRARGDTP